MGTRSDYGIDILEAGNPASYSNRYVAQRDKSSDAWSFCYSQAQHSDRRTATDRQERRSDRGAVGLGPNILRNKTTDSGNSVVLSLQQQYEAVPKVASAQRQRGDWTYHCIESELCPHWPELKDMYGERVYRKLEAEDVLGEFWEFVNGPSEPEELFLRRSVEELWLRETTTRFCK